MFVWSAHFGGAALCVIYAIIGFIALLVWVNKMDSATYWRRRGIHKQPFRETLRFASICVAIVWFISGLSSINAKPYRSNGVTTAQVTDLFGLKSDQAYPLVLGDKINGSSGIAYARGGFFSATAYTTQQPASSITVSFTAQEKSYILEIPTAKVVFVQSNAPPTVKIHLVGDGQYDAAWVRHYSGCSFAFTNLTPGCRKKVVSEKLVLNTDSARRGLAPIVQTSLDSATITLSPDTYKQLVGERN